MDGIAEKSRKGESLFQQIYIVNETETSPVSCINVLVVGPGVEQEKIYFNKFM